MSNRLHNQSAWILAAGFLTIMAMSQPVQAEPPIQTSPVTRELLKGAAITAGVIGKTLSAVSPSCSQALEKCWETHGMNKDNYEQVQDTCWKETTHCPQVCKDQYFRYRKAGMKSPKAENKVLFSKPPCAPGLE